LEKEKADKNMKRKPNDRGEVIVILIGVGTFVLVSLARPLAMGQSNDVVNAAIFSPGLLRV